MMERCKCGHHDGEHKPAGRGRCAGECIDLFAGTFVACPCPRFIKKTTKTTKGNK